MKENKRILYFDVLNIMACFCVILMHHNGIVHFFSDTMQWKQALIVEVVAYWAVPVFFMLTGATLLDYSERYDTKTFFKKRVFRTLIPFLLWSIISLVVYRKLGTLSFDDFSVKSILNAIINTKIEPVYWFFPTYFGVCLGIPVLSVLRKNRTVLWYMVGVSFLFNSCLPPLLGLLNIQWNGAIGFPVTTYLVYVVWGYLLSTEHQSKKKCIVAAMLAVFAMIFRYVAIYKLSFRDGTKNGLFFSYGYFTAVLLAIGVFVVVKKICTKYLVNSRYINTALTRISACSFGIYLIHRLVMIFEQNCIFVGIETESLFWRTAGALVTYMICLVLVYVMKKIPILRKVVP